MAGATQLSSLLIDGVCGRLLAIGDSEQKRPRPMTSTRCLSEVWPIELMAIRKDWLGHPRRAIADDILIGESRVIVHDPASNFLGVTLPPLLESSSLNDHTNVLFVAFGGI